MVFTIIYNPYLQKLDFIKDGYKLRKNNRFKKILNQKNGHWLMKPSEWEEIFEEMKRHSDGEGIEIEFCGRSCDYDDILNYEMFYKDREISFLKPVLIENESSLIEELFAFVKELELKDQFTRDLTSAFENIYNENFKICVIATMSSGKSTLINAMLGQDLLPSNTAACTATITTMTDNDEMKVFTSKCFDKDGNLLNEKEAVTLDDLEMYNKEPQIEKIDLEGPIPAITTSKFNLHLIDTPGPNNSTNEQHETLTNKIIESDDYAMVIYVMSPATIQSDDNNELFQSIANIMKKDGKQAEERFLFVINKCDYLDPEDEDDTIESVMETTKKYLKQKGFDHPNIFPMTSELAKLIRMNERGYKITRRDRKEIKNWVDNFEEDQNSNYQKFLSFEKYATLSVKSREKINNRLMQAKAENNKQEQALIHTGLPALEEAIEDYLQKNVYPMKIKEFVEVTDTYLNGKILSDALETYFLEKINKIKYKNELIKKIEMLMKIRNNTDIHFYQADDTKYQIKSDLEYMNSLIQVIKIIVSKKQREEAIKFLH